ncbi:MAG: NfeD family protein [Spirochaetota bacterium]
MFLGPSFLWGVIGLLLIASEMLIPGFTIFFFGLGAWLVAVLVLVFPFLEASFAWQVLAWAAASVLSFAFLRRKFTKLFKGTLLNRRAPEGLGERALVLEPITPEEPGRVRYRGTSWKAMSLTESFKKGDEVAIVGEDGITLTVTAPFDE